MSVPKTIDVDFSMVVSFRDSENPNSGGWFTDRTIFVCALDHKDNRKNNERRNGFIGIQIWFKQDGEILILVMFWFTFNFWFKGLNLHILIKTNKPNIKNN